MPWVEHQAPGAAKLKNWLLRSESAGLQVPQASSSESSIAMVDATARADEAAWDTALGGVSAAECSLQDRPREAQR